MPKTSVMVLFGTNALTMKEDMTFTLVSETLLQPFVDVNDMKIEIPENVYVTHEPDFWKLDGTYKFLPPTNAKAGIVSLLQSNAGGVFPDQPHFELIFSVDYSTDKFVIYFDSFSNDYATEFVVRFQDEFNNNLYNVLWTNDSPVFTLNETITGFRKIVLIFNKVNKPFHYLRIKGFDFDEVVRFTGGDVKAANIVEEISPISVELPSNKLDLTLFSSSGDFSIVDPQGVYATIAENQPIDIYEQINNDLYHIGRYFISDWDSLSEQEAIFKCYDLIGILDSTPFTYFSDVGFIFEGMSVSYAVTHIMANIGLEVEIDPAIASATVRGWLPITTIREALQQIMFAAGGYITCSRSGIMQVKPLTLASDLGGVYDHIFTNQHKGLNSPITRRPLVTGVEITAHRYLSDGLSPKVLYTSNLAAGVYNIIFNDVPHFDYSATGATVTDSSSNNVIINVASPGTVTVSGRSYLDSKSTVTVYAAGLPANTQPNIVKINTATLVSPDMAVSVAQRVLDYYAQRYVQETKLFASTLQVGNTVRIDVQSNRQVAGITERMASDLVNGMVSTVEIVGIVLPE